MVSLRVNLKIAGQDNKLKNNSEEDNTNYDRDSDKYYAYRYAVP